MPSNPLYEYKCVFCCESQQLRYPHVFHPFKCDHGPFDIYVCTHCGSSQTNPIPSSKSLASLYNSYHNGLPDLHRRITEDDPQTYIYQKCIRRISKLWGKCKEDKFTWLDVGAGGGELSMLMAKEFPNSFGIAIDQHSCPKALKNISNLEWLQLDINQEHFSAQLPSTDLIVSIAVWEHVRYPDLFVSNLFCILNPEGMLYLMCPNNASYASRLLRSRWVYFTPGEHLAIPTPLGATHCLQREWKLLHGDKIPYIKVRGMTLPYTFRYVLRRLGFEKWGMLIPPGWNLPFPAGVLEAITISKPVKIGDR